MCRSPVRRAARDSSRGFTLIEIMVVVAIVGLLTTFVAQSAIRHHHEAAVIKAQADVDRIADAARVFYLVNHRMPTWEQLITPDANGRPWIEPHRDPWGSDYQLVRGDLPGVLEVRCFGPDGQQGTEDDVVALAR